ncbi:MAG: LysR substrate-binding domain-containing protein [Anaerovoracaceae bacterium]
MDISSLREFLVLAETGSFSAAAYHLHMSQSTLSRHIQTLERELGYSLFHRTTRNVQLTEYGRLYLPYVKRITEDATKAAAALKNLEKQRNTRTLIGIVHNPDLYMITEFIRTFRRDYPDILLKIQEGSLRELHRAFSAGQIRIITMTFADWEKPQHGFLPAGRSRLVAVLPESHPLACMEKIPLQSLKNVHLLVPDQTTFTYQYLEYMLRQEGVQPEIVYQGNTTGLSGLLNDGMGILIQDQAQAQKQAEPPLVIRQLEPDISYAYGLEYRSHLTKNERTFVNFVRSMLSN